MAFKAAQIQSKPHSAVLTAAHFVPEFLWDVSAEDLFVLTKFCKVERTGASAGWKWLWTLCWLA